MNEQSINAFLRAVGECRFDDLQTVLVPRTSLRWITPGGVGADAGVDPVVDRFRQWFDWYKHIDIVSTDSQAMGGRFLFSYQFRVQKPDGGWNTVQQQGVLDADDAAITAIDLVCTGLV